MQEGNFQNQGPFFRVLSVYLLSMLGEMVGYILLGDPDFKKSPKEARSQEFRPGQSTPCVFGQPSESCF